LLNEFLLLATAHLFAVASPGADFAVVLRNTLRSGQTAGTFTALGVGLGILVHVGYTLLGVALLLAQSPQLYEVITYAGAAYILWLAFQSFKSRPQQQQRQSKQSQKEISNLSAIKQGFLVNVLNPKVTVFFIALFTSIVSQTTPVAMQSVYGAWLALYTFLWFWFVAWWFSRQAVLNWYQRQGHIVDWLMGVVLILIAIRLLI
jgi:RhtB (resistance to homoserine/threonine) family protein